MLGEDMCVSSEDDMLNAGDAVCCGVMLALRVGSAPNVVGTMTVEFLR